MRVQKKRRGWAGFLWIVALAAILVEVLRFIPSGYVMISPGITGNLAEMVHVKGGHPPGPGKLLMVAVDLGPASEFQYLVNHFNPTVEFLPIQQALGGLNMNQYVQLNLNMMQQSQWAAEVAGERLAGLPAKIVTVPGALVTGVLKTGTAINKILPGDLIVKIGPYPVTSPNQVRAIMEQHYQVGQWVSITVRRHGVLRVVRVRTTHIALDPAPAIGVAITALQKPVVPRPVTIKANNIGGPSAGMMFALEIYDQITGRDIAHHQVVAGTGEILPNGQVDSIGGVAQKVVTVYRAGARIFLCPVANYPKAKAMASRMGYPMKIYPVATLSQALHDIQAATS